MLRFGGPETCGNFGGCADSSTDAEQLLVIAGTFGVYGYFFLAPFLHRDYQPTRSLSQDQACSLNAAKH